MKTLQVTVMSLLLSTALAPGMVQAQSSDAGYRQQAKADERADKAQVKADKAEAKAKPSKSEKRAAKAQRKADKKEAKAANPQ